MATILYITDDASTGLVLEQSIAGAGHAASAARTIGEALQSLLRSRFELIIADSSLPGLTAVELVMLLNREGIDAPLIMLAEDEAVDAVPPTAIRCGVQCVSKPVRGPALQAAVQRALHCGALHRENERLRREVAAASADSRIIGTSEAIREILQVIRVVAPTDSAVLLQGESGTGRKTMARALHELGARRNEPFVQINCAALPAGLMESALLGHERGAFTGAVRRVEGAFERANGGTLVLEEVDAVPAEFQARVLRVLETGAVTRMGATSPLRIDVRVIATATRSLSAEVDAGRFNPALARRLSTVVIDVPPLRSRGGDIPALAHHFAGETAAEVSKPAPRISPEALEILLDYSWPGNVREMRHAIERAVILSQDAVLGAHHFDQERGMRAASLVQQVMARDARWQPPALNVGMPSTPAGGIVLHTLNVDEAEKALIARALEVTGGNRTRTAELLGISVRTLRNKLNGPLRVASAG